MRRFYLEPYLGHPENHPLREAVTRMIRQDALKIYRDKKAKFKKTWFTDRGGSQRLAELEGQPPYGMPPQVWSYLLGYWTSEPRLIAAQRNTTNRQQQNNFVSTHGRQSYAQREWRYAEDNDGRREDPPEFYLRAHTRRDGMVQDAVMPIYERLLDTHQRLSQVPNTPPTQTYVDALRTRSGHTRVVGRVVRGTRGLNVPLPEDIEQPFPAQQSPSFNVNDMFAQGSSWTQSSFKDGPSTSSSHAGPSTSRAPTQRLGSDSDSDSDSDDESD
uniref:uncharacterized protein LOC122585833 n=1 Tax=Erigeron canadensis TaxID=72917 RepID=UPI001CB900BF|nr:uncharacterized protein LOC122585833 [Erigeron canadensis]